MFFFSCLVFSSLCLFLVFALLSEYNLHHFHSFSFPHLLVAVPCCLRPEFTLLVEPPAGDPDYLIAEIQLPGVVRYGHTYMNTLSPSPFLCTLSLSAIICYKFYLLYLLLTVLAGKLRAPHKGQKCMQPHGHY